MNNETGDRNALIEYHAASLSDWRGQLSHRCGPRAWLIHSLISSAPAVHVTRGGVNRPDKDSRRRASLRRP